MKCEKLVPISNHEPVFLIKNKKLNNIISQNKSTIENTLLIWTSERILIELNVQVIINIGIVILITIKIIIVNGLNTVKKFRTHIGSNEFRLAILPVPKNDINTKPNCNIH